MPAGRTPHVPPSPPFSSQARCSTDICTGLSLYWYSPVRTPFSDHAPRSLNRQTGSCACACSCACSTVVLPTGISSMARRNDGNSNNANFCRLERDRVASFRSFITANRRRERRGNHPAHSIPVLDSINSTHHFTTQHTSCSTQLPCDSSGHPCSGECRLLELVPVPVGTGMPPSHRGIPSAAPE